MRDERHGNLAERERRIREAIRSTADVRADAAFRERLKREFSSGTLSEPVIQRKTAASRGLPHWAWILVPAATATLIVALWLPGPAPSWSLQAVLGEGHVQIEGQALATGEMDLVARALASGGRLRVPGEISLDVRLDDRLVLALDEGADVTLPPPPKRGAQGPLISEVHDGELRIKTGPGFSGTELHILTAEGRTEITGTVVSVYKGDGYTCVCVLQGTALVGPDEAHLEAVPHGMLKVLFDDGTPPIVTEIASQHEADLLEFSERYEDLFVSPE